MSTEAINILKNIEIIQKSIFVLLFIITGLGTISVIVNIIRLSIIRMILSMILVVSAMIVNIVSKFLTFDIIVHHISTKTLIPAIVLILIQIIIAIILIINIVKKKNKV